MEPVEGNAYLSRTGITLVESSEITERIAFWVKQFADVLEMPEVWTDVEDLLQRGSANNTQLSS